MTEMNIPRTTGVMAFFAAGALMLLTSACSGQQQPESAAATAAGNQTTMSFDLNACQQLGPSLYQCPGSDKPICDTGYNKGDVECLKVDENGVLIQTL
jgi:hypothetical protein